jgi:CspA family cold shock protein
MGEDEQAAPVVQGRVKWFDPTRGFGFVVSDETEVDILLHANVLRNFGQGSVADGAGIVVRVQRTQRGMQAMEVLRIDPPDGVTFPLSDEGGQPLGADILTLAMEPARVKWFDKGKGFGFANVFGRNEDIFIHAEVLRVSGFADLAAGEAVALRVAEGKRGRMAVQVLPWEVGSRQAT